MNNVYVTTEKLRELGIDHRLIKDINTVLKVSKACCINHNETIVIDIPSTMIDNLKSMSNVERGLDKINHIHLISHMKEFCDFDNEVLRDFMENVCDFLLSVPRFSTLAMRRYFNLNANISLALIMYLFSRHMITQSGTQYKVTNENKLVIETYKEILDNEK